jgi:hypothetical protein
LALRPGAFVQWAGGASEDDGRTCRGHSEPGGRDIRRAVLRKAMATLKVWRRRGAETV